ncbi:hypothetical protein ERO13_D05G081800v2 [Gossypium hirsutum]|uniref:Uncharacterized protein n=1 Tax=Gossypium hirsutum TaxID=3635 RepID=A0ABM3A387_GOSHI|nr:uncharacterized protein LOC107906678 [Gossypium hirsutum]KAG4145174.1 hypothetical protein ERO13_D05G081800v2 [Gossypium hirsutum]KAG4145175.1 hypothetical protein ERO13_D05G081800v2 [Gossypium hirsutum]KAG4145176.1 hypothetical protein ERO13_D05G081800v2 [Gossypium hirsutum]KAG4145177.1 hypothetical protein ERO13_D05G081800v2 [Gossypium hirsutum]
MAISRPMLLVFLLLILIMTSQFEWRHQIVDFDITPSVTPKQQQISRREEAVKEKNIQRLQELVRSLQQQLLQCKGNNKTNDTISHLTEHVLELERQQILED